MILRNKEIKNKKESCRKRIEYVKGEMNTIEQMLKSTKDSLDIEVLEKDYKRYQKLLDNYQKKLEELEQKSLSKLNIKPETRKRIALLLMTGALGISVGENIALGTQNARFEEDKTAIESILKDDNMLSEDRDVLEGVILEDKDSISDLYKDFEEIRCEYMKSLETRMLDDINGYFEGEAEFVDISIVKYKDKNHITAGEPYKVDLKLANGKSISLKKEKEMWTKLNPLIDGYDNLKNISKEDYTPEELGEKVKSDIVGIEKCMSKYDLKKEKEHIKVVEDKERD